MNHGQIGPSLQFNTRPFEKLKRITIFELDDLQCMPVVFTIGQAYALKLTTELLEKRDEVAERSLKRQWRSAQTEIPLGSKTRFSLKCRVSIPAAAPIVAELHEEAKQRVFPTASTADIQNVETE